MTDLACRNIAVGVPVLHSSHMAACCRTSPCADGKASTPFLTEKRFVSREFMVRDRAPTGAPGYIAGESRARSG